MTLERRDDTQVHVDEETLRYLGYDPANVATRALVLLANRYQLDPLLGEILLINGKGGVRVYVTHDGALTVAHRSPMFDGMEAEQRRNTTGDGWTAYVTVYRKDMTHPFRYGAQCKDSEAQAKAGLGPEMALARAERRSLMRAFAIADFDPARETVDPDADLEAVVNLDGTVDMVPVVVAPERVDPYPKVTAVGDGPGAAASPEAPGPVTETPAGDSPGEVTVPGRP